MKQNKLISKLRCTASFLLCSLLMLAFGGTDVSAQSRKEAKKASVSVIIVDQNGKGIPFAEVSVGEGAIHRIADMSGAVSFIADARDVVTVSKDGYASVNALVEAMTDSKYITLYEDKLFASESDIVPLPYTDMLQRYSVGSTIVIKGEDLEKYSSTDIRNALTAIAPGVEVTENFGDPGVNPLENTNRYGAAWAVSPTARGRRMVYMVDDVMVNINETPLDPQQIESITIIRDVLEKTLYGPSGAEGIVYIKTKLLDYFSNRLYFVEKLSYDRTFGKHRVNAGADYMITKRSQKFITEHRREMNAGFNAGYVYDDKYIIQTAMNWHGTYSLLKNSWAYSPSVGLGWIMSEESWLKDAEQLDFLKLRLQGGILHYDSATSAHRDVDNYSWNNSASKFGPYGNNQWFGSTQSENINRTYVSMLGNPNLRMEQRKELTAGIDGLAFNRRFNFSLNYYNVLSDGPITQLSNVLPIVAGISSGALWMNYNKTRYQGVELSLGWKDRVGDFSYSVDGWATSQFSKVLRVDEMNYKQAYRSRVGYSNTAIWGLRHIGQFQSYEETLEVPQLFDERLAAGDLKYQDMNGDGFVDDNDVCVIGDSAPKLIYALNINLKYRDFDLFISGTGRAFYDIALTNGYFWNGWGDGNYSKYTLDHVGQAGHPRLTYNKVDNNYKTSAYWLTDGSFFKIQTVELGYELPVRRLNITRGLRGLRVYVRGNNLLTLSKVKYVDPEAINSGLSNYPLMKTVVAGIKVTF